MKSPFRSQLGVDLVFGSAWATALLAGWALVVAPVQGRREALAAQERELGELNQKAKELDEMRAAQSQRLTEIERALSGLRVRLQDAGALNQRLAELTNLADQIGADPRRGLKVEQITPGTPTVGPRFTTVPIRLSGVSTYAAASAFLERLQERFPDTGVTGLTLKVRGEDTAEAEFGMDLVWYAAGGGGAKPADSNAPRSGEGRAGAAARPGA